MSDDSTDSQRPLGQRLKHGLESKILIPTAAAIVTVAVKYLVKKLPMILEEKVLPKLLEKDAPEQVTRAVEGTATAFGGTDGDSASRAEDAEQEQPEQERPARAETSNQDREAERRKREERRLQRKRALEKTA